MATAAVRLDAPKDYPQLACRHKEEWLMPAPTPPQVGLDQPSTLQIYDRYIEYVRHENELIHQRTTLVVTTQGGFLLLLSYTLQRYVDLITALYGFRE